MGPKVLTKSIIGIVVFSFVFSIFLIPPVAHGQTTINVPGDYSTIQAAIDAANPGDTINVAAGTYNENISWEWPDVTIQGAGADVTTINGGANGSPVLNIYSRITAASTLDGFTITNGFSTKGGGGILTSAPLNISNCVFTNNTASGKNSNGGGIFAGAPPTVVNCTFSGNTATDGGAIYNDKNNSNLVVTNCVLWGNTGGEIGNRAGATTSVSYSNVQGGYTGTGNINQDPRFVGGGDYSLSSDSPCIDAGNPASSVPTNGGWYRDMGALEYTGADCVRAVTGTGELLFGGQAKARVNVTDQGSLSQITVTAHPGQPYPGTEGDTVQRWYEITASGAGTCDLTLSYLDGELGSETEASLVLWRKGAGDWELMGGTVNASENTVTVNGVTGFSDWVIADNPSGDPPVPELLTILFIGMGVIALAAFAWWRRRQRVAVIA